MRFLIAAAVTLLLTGCFDADITLSFSEDGEVEIKEVTRMSGELAAMANQGNGCDGGTKAFVDNLFTCTRVRTVPVDTFLKDSQTIGFGPNGEGPELSATQLDDETLQVSFNFDQRASFAPDNGMGALVQSALDGHNLSFKVKGYKIIDTTGEQPSEDPIAQRVIPLSEILKAEPDFGGSFTTVVQIAPKCWLFGLMCD